MLHVTTDREKFITGTCGNENYNVPYDEERYEKLVELEESAENASTVDEMKAIVEEAHGIIESFTADEVMECAIPGLVYVAKTGEYHVDLGNGMYTDLYAPEKLKSLLTDNKERGISNEPLVNMFIRMCNNIKPTQKRLDMLLNYITQTWTNEEEVSRLMEEEGLSRKAATERATYMDMQVTKQGIIKTTKVVEELTMKWSIVKDSDGKPVLDSEGKPKKELVPRYATSYEIDEDSGEVKETVKEPEYLEERTFTPAICRSGERFASIALDGTCKNEEGYVYRIGEVARLKSWDSVALEDGVGHVKGFHTGGLRYIEMYNNKSREVLNTFVCPSMIGKFCDAGLGEMTCKEYFFHGCSTIEGTTRNLYNASTYAEVLASQLKEDMAKAAEEIKKRKDTEALEEVKVAEIAKIISKMK